MNIIKITSIFTLGIAILISGGMFFSNTAKAQQQQASPAEVRVTSDGLSEIGDGETFETPLQQQVPSNQDESSAQSIPGIQGASRQIISLQQQVEGRMIACAQDADQAQRVIVDLRAQEDNLEARRDVLNSQLRGVNSSTPEGRDQRSRIQAERTTLENQRTQLRSSLSQTRQAYSQSRSACRQELSQLRSLKRQAENQLNREFSDSLNVVYR